MRLKINYEIDEKQPFSPEQLIKIILQQRKIKDIKNFLNPIAPEEISLFDFNPTFKRRFIKVAQMLQEIIKNNQQIVIYTDYDADGITGGAILWETLYTLGFNVMPYVPDRKTEGYGFTEIGIDNMLRKFNPVLVISVDQGITKVKETNYLKEKGIKVIITDHHLKGKQLPKADGIFHIPELSGAGVAYFFAKEIFATFKNKIKESNKVKILEKNFRDDYISLASIGIVADLVPLIGPSRSLVKFGLERLSQTTRLGLKHIINEAGIKTKKITPYEIGFIIAPRINAIGRLENALDALRLLCTKKEERAFNLAKLLGQTNRLRQNILQMTLNEAKNLLAKETNNFKNLPKIIILKSESWHEGIIGLVASKLTEEFYRPTIVLTRTDGVYKGSARSIFGFHITYFLRSLKEFLIDVGGHEQASGFSLEEEKVDKFIIQANSKANRLFQLNQLEKVITVDFKIPLSLITLQLVELIEKLQPFGIGNQAPIFYSQGKIAGAKLFGKNNEHLKIILSPFENKNYLKEFIFFDGGPLFKILNRDQKIGLVYYLEINHWNGIKKPRGKILYIEVDGVIKKT